MALTNLQKKIRRCKIARQHNQHNDCESDWCPYCGQAKNNWLKSETLTFVENSEQPFFTTILLKPRATLQQMIGDAKQTLLLLNAIGVDCIGSFEVATNHNTNLKNWTNFAEYSGYMPGLHKGIGHLHIITKNSYRELLALHFPIKGQVKEIPIGSGHHKSKSLEENIDHLIGYIRKRHSVNEWWMSELDDDQLIYKIESGSLYNSIGNNWFQSKEQDKEIIVNDWTSTGLGKRIIFNDSDQSDDTVSTQDNAKSEKGCGGQYLQGSVRVNDRIVTIETRIRPSRKDSIKSNIMLILEKMKAKNRDSLSRDALDAYNQIKKEEKNQKEESPIESNDLFIMPEKKEIKVEKIAKERTWGIMTNRNRYDEVKFGKYQGKMLEEMCADTGYMQALIHKNPQILRKHYPKS